MNEPAWENPKFYRGALFALVVLCIALIVHEIFGEHGYLALREQQKQYDALQHQIQQLQQENRQLESEVKALKSDPKAIEKLAREQMRLARPGEIIYTLPDQQAKPEPATAAKGDPPK
jgi:cell division protein FtsB